MGSDSGAAHGGARHRVPDLAQLQSNTGDLEFAVEVTPNRKLEGKVGWECLDRYDNIKVYLDIKGSNPHIGDYMIQRNGEYERIASVPYMYKLTWTGKAEFAEGPLATFSPIDTNMVASVNLANLHVDANIVKSFGGKRWGFTLANDKFTLISGRP